MRIDDLKAGQMIVMTGAKEDPNICPCQRMHDPALSLMGDVIRVVAVNLPFIAARSVTGETFMLDARKYAFVRANRSYVNACYQASMDCECPSCKPVAVAVKGGGNCCPGCGGKLVERRVASGQWAFRCKECEPA